jgi:hypothetical protein
MAAVDKHARTGPMGPPATDGRPHSGGRPAAANAEVARPAWAGWAALGGITGALALGASFGIVPKPPAVGAPTAALNAYAKAHHYVLLWSAWLEGIGTLLYVTFLLSLVHLADANRRISGTLTLLAAAVVLGISLVYDVCLIAMAQAPALGGPQLRTGSVAYGLWAACEHAFLIAPAILLPLGFALRGSTALPLAFGNSAIVLGCISEVLGLIGLFYAHPNNGGAAGNAIDVLVAAEVIWVLAAAGYTLRRYTRRQPAVPGLTSTGPDHGTSSPHTKTGTTTRLVPET